jgi:hypothetical protein
MIPDSFYGIVFEKASHLTSCPLRKRNWTSYPEELRPHAPPKETRQPTDSKCMGFDEVRKKGAFFCKKSETECFGNYQVWELSSGPTICSHVTASDQNNFNKQLEEATSSFA